MTDRVDGLTTTGYAVLGLLALQSWTGYELTQQARRSFAFAWPKEESLIYAQPRRLEALGLARSRKEQQHGRTRNRYFITPAGRRAFRNWLASPPAPTRFEGEAMLRLMFADHATPEDNRRAVEALRDWALDRMTVGSQVVDSYRQQTDPFPARRHLNVLNALFHAVVAEAILTWTDRALDHLESWDPRQPDQSSLDTAALLDELQATLAVSLSRRAAAD